MKTDELWIEDAVEGLKSNKIVQKNSGPSAKYVFPKEFKGYISSFAATIVQSGLLPALVIFERTDSGAAAGRHLLPLAILYLLSKRKLIPAEVEKFPLLSDMYSHLSSSDEKKGFQRNIEKATVALKQAIRMFEPVKSVKIQQTDGQNEVYTENTEAVEVIEISEYRLKEGCQNTMANIGWLYYRDYYRDFCKYKQKVKYKYQKADKTWSKEYKEGVLQEIIFEGKKNPFILSSQLKEMLDGNKKLTSSLAGRGFVPLKFQTLYPGLLIGLGLSHGTPIENDLKCGFQFDYTTGLPVIPGSSVKGVLRSVFPKTDNKPEDKKYNRQRLDYIRSLLAEQDIHCSKDDDIFRLVKQMFCHVEENFDVFMDAVITGGPAGRFMGDDYLAPHVPNLYKDPVPIQFIKVLPEVEFTFFFKLAPFEINKKKVDKLKLFRRILEDIGIGAKTNVGYGRLKSLDERKD